MPKSLIHLKIGYEYAKKYKKYDNGNFYLGLIAPDTVNLNGFAEKQIRWNAHLRAKDLEEWKRNILKFYNENKEKYNESYIYGYLIHVLTDILFDENNPNQLFPKIEAKVGKDKLREEYGIQMDLYECSELKEEWFQYVKQKLNEAKAETINNIDKTQIEAWKKHVLNEYNKKTIKQYDLLDNNYILRIIEQLIDYTKNVNKVE